MQLTNPLPARKAVNVWWWWADARQVRHVHALI
jgi:hypothetical protein